MKNQILSVLPEGHPWQNNIIYFPTLPSTNDLAKKMAQDGAPEGTVILADAQTAGRGRMGRQFYAPAGKGLYLSVILRPNCQPSELMHLTCAVAVAACDAVAALCGLRPQVKWINDLILGRKKLGGILTELSLEPESGKVSWAVVGIGINCNCMTSDFPTELQDIATSLQIQSGKAYAPAQLAGHFINELLRIYKGLFSCKREIMNQYRRDCITLGSPVILLRDGQKIPGTAMDMDDDGAMHIRLEDGSVQTVCSGEISIRGIAGYL